MLPCLACLGTCPDLSRYPMFILFIVQVKQGNKQKLNLCVSACLAASVYTTMSGGGEADVLFLLLSIAADWG